MSHVSAAVRVGPCSVPAQSRMSVTSRPIRRAVFPISGRAFVSFRETSRGSKYSTAPTCQVVYINNE